MDAKQGKKKNYRAGGMRMSGLALYTRYIRMLVTSEMAYKTSFVLMTTGNFLLQIIEFVGILALFDRFKHIHGWSLYEVAMFYGVVHCAFALSEAFGRGYDTFHIHVKRGTLDRLLLRPRNLSLQILGSDFQVMRIGRFLQGLVVLVFGIMNLEIRLGGMDYLLIVLAIAGGSFVFTGLFVLQATLSFFTVESIEIANALTYGGTMTAQYPITIYKKWFQRIFMYIIPIGSIGFLPLNAVLRDGSVLAGLIVPVVGFLFLILTFQIFKVGLKHYCSTGS